MPAVDATDERFLAPADMAAELVACSRTRGGASRAEVIRSAVESMARSTAAVVRQLGLPNVQVFGGELVRTLLLRLLAEHVDGTVTVGPVEATALGNALSQGLALGVFRTVAEGRQTLSRDDSDCPGGRTMNVDSMDRLELMRQAPRHRRPGARRATRR